MSSRSSSAKKTTHRNRGASMAASTSLRISPPWVTTLINTGRAASASSSPRSIRCFLRTSTGDSQRPPCFTTYLISASNSTLLSVWRSLTKPMPEFHGWDTYLHPQHFSHIGLALSKNQCLLKWGDISDYNRTSMAHKHSYFTKSFAIVIFLAV